MRAIRSGSALLFLSGWVVLLSSQESILAADEQQPSDWSKSAEAVFLTSPERREWKSLRMDTARTQFEIDYWRRRDPDPTTPRNEFKELVQARIAEADRQFSTSKQRGADTARGRVFVLLGPASIERQTLGPLDTAPRYTTPFEISLPPGALERREWHVWVYDHRNPEILAAAKRPSVEISFAIDTAHRDSLQNPGKFEPIREAVARASIHQPPSP